MAAPKGTPWLKVSASSGDRASTKALVSQPTWAAALAASSPAATIERDAEATIKTLGSASMSISPCAWRRPWRSRPRSSDRRRPGRALCGPPGPARCSCADRRRPWRRHGSAGPRRRPGRGQCRAWRRPCRPARGCDANGPDGLRRHAGIRVRRCRADEPAPGSSAGGRGDAAQHGGQQRVAEGVCVGGVAEQPSWRAQPAPDVRRSAPGRRPAASSESISSPAQSSQDSTRASVQSWAPSPRRRGRYVRPRAFEA
jgi:hypothetical protein